MAASSGLRKAMDQKTMPIFLGEGTVNWRGEITERVQECIVELWEEIERLRVELAKEKKRETTDLRALREHYERRANEDWGR